MFHQNLNEVLHYAVKVVIDFMKLQITISRSALNKINDNEERRLLGCGAVWLL
jgi:hypothetical protein